MLTFSAGSIEVLSGKSRLMTYISRRIALTREDGGTEEYSDTAFFGIDAPLIVIGEPGAGKSALAAGSRPNKWSRFSIRHSARDIFIIVSSFRTANIGAEP